MATFKPPFAYNTGGPIDGTSQYGDLVVGNVNVDYSSDYGGVKWWASPEETTGYIIGNARPGGQPVPSGVTGTAQVGFWRSKGRTDQAFLDLANYIGAKNGQPTFTTTYQAEIWLENNGYYTSFNLPTPTPTATSQSTVTPTPTNTMTPTVTQTPTNTSTPTNTQTQTQTPTPSITASQTVTPTPSVTATQTSTPTVTQTPTITTTSTVTPTPSTSPIPVTGYGYNLVVLPYNPPTSGNTIFPTFATPGLNSGTTNPNTFNVNGIYWNVIDTSSIDRTSYYSGMTGVSVTAYFTQNGNTAIYSGSPTAFVYDTAGSVNFNYNPGARPNQLVLIQSASTNFVTGQTVYISYVVNVATTPTPTPTNTTTPTTTTTPTPTQTLTPTTTTTPTPTQTPQFFLLFEDSSIATAENNNNIEIDII